MDVPVGIGKDVGLETQLFGTRTHHTAGRFHTFLHHVAQHAGTKHLSLARESHGFNHQNVAAHFGPRKTVDNADLRFTLSRRNAETPHTEVLLKRFGRDADRKLRGTLVLRCLELRQNDLAQNLAHSTFERAYARFTRVVADDVAHRAFFHHHFVFLHAVDAHLLRNEVAHRDVHLFVFGIARKRNHLHTVKQCRRNVIAVGGRHEEHVRQVEWRLNVVVFKGVVLLRIKHFKQRCSRITAVIGADLVDLVQEEKRILNLSLDHVLNDLPRHRTHVGTAMTADFRFIGNAAQGHAYVFAVRRPGNRAAKRSFADARAAYEAENRRLDLAHALLHGEIFKNALLHLFESPMILIEDTASPFDVAVDAALLLPGQFEKRLDVAAHDARF